MGRGFSLVALALATTAGTAGLKACATAVNAQARATAVGASVSVAQTFRSAEALGPAQSLADGVEYFEPKDVEALGLPAPSAVQMVRIDPARANLDVMLARDRIAGSEPVAAIGERHRAIAAVNAGFFNVPTGEPVGVVKVDGELVSDAPLPRGAVAFHCGADGVRLTFDRVRTHQTLRFTSKGEKVEFPISGVNTPRHLEQLMLYTPRYAMKPAAPGKETKGTGTASSGTEWILARAAASASTWRVVERRAGGDSAIPKDGAVLSFGGPAPPPLQKLIRGTTVQIVTRYDTLLDSRPEDWEAASDITNGAGLLVHNGKELTDWSVERFREGFTTERHPRTIIGVDGDKRVWMVTIDGRNPSMSIGATFADLQRLSRTLGLRDALNLDGGGSTTMVAAGRIRNHPSDPTGPRPISDAILVSPGRCCR